MSILCGSHGTLRIGSNELTPLLRWKLTLIGRNLEYLTNHGGAWTQRAAGTKDCAGSFALHAAADGHCPVDVGEAVTLELHADDSGENYYQVPAIVDRIAVEAEIGEGRPLAYAVDFSGNGRFTAHGALAST